MSKAPTATRAMQIAPPVRSFPRTAPLVPLLTLFPQQTRLATIAVAGITFQEHTVIRIAHPPQLRPLQIRQPILPVLRSQ